MALRGVYGGFRAKHRYITESKCFFLNMCARCHGSYEQL